MEKSKAKMVLSLDMDGNRVWNVQRGQLWRDGRGNSKVNLQGENAKSKDWFSMTVHGDFEKERGGVL